MLVYLDWNVYSNIKKIGSGLLSSSDELIYQEIKNLCNRGVIQTPYSNAHINDLLRGYHKDPSYINGDLEILKSLTNDLCIVQYWDNEKVLWHNRDPFDFFNTALSDLSWYCVSIDDLFDKLQKPLDYLPPMEKLKFQLQLSIMKIKLETPMGALLKPLYKQDPIFGVMFPKSKEYATMRTFMEDILGLMSLFKKDFAIYKGLKSYLNRTKVTLSSQKKLISKIEKANEGIPKHLILEAAFSKAWDDGIKNQKSTSKNSAFHQITNIYYKLNFQGQKSDEKFANMVDDALHVFYGSHCAYFVTMDDRCHYKADLTYKQLQWPTKTLKPADFVMEMQSI